MLLQSSGPFQGSPAVRKIPLNLNWMLTSLIVLCLIRESAFLTDREGFMCLRRLWILTQLAFFPMIGNFSTVAAVKVTNSPVCTGLEVGTFGWNWKSLTAWKIFCNHHKGWQCTQRILQNPVNHTLFLLILPSRSRLFVRFVVTEMLTKFCVWSEVESNVVYKRRQLPPSWYWTPWHRLSSEQLDEKHEIKKKKSHVCQWCYSRLLFGNIDGNIIISTTIKWNRMYLKLHFILDSLLSQLWTSPSNTKPSSIWIKHCILSTWQFARNASKI